MKLMEPSTIFVPPPFLVGVELNPGPALSTWDRSRIIILKQDAGLSNEKIAEIVPCHVDTVRATLKRFRETKSLSNRPGQGPKRKLSKKDERKVKRKAKSGHSST